MSKPVLRLNGVDQTIEAGESLLQCARRAGVEIPSLCDDPRLDAAGACRSCLVEVEGTGRLQPSCITAAAPGMVVRTDTERVGRHRRTLMAMYMADLPPDVPGAEFRQAAEVCGATTHDWPGPWPELEPVRGDRQGDRNPYVDFDAALCIACGRCTRYCDEVEAVSAITLAGRGAETTISTSFGASLLDSTCELCGGCIDVCPTGAMREKAPLSEGIAQNAPLQKVRTTCNYCGVGCQLDLRVDPAGHDGRGKVVRIDSPPAGTTTNDGNLCVKGRFAYEFIGSDDRLKTPLIRRENGQLEPCGWGEAITAAVAGLKGVQDRHGDDALGFISSSRCTVEENYLTQKLARAVFHTNNVHQCAAT